MDMSKLVLKFESAVLKEVAVGTKEVSIGRSPECGIVIDNPAVSNYHARVFNEEGRMMLEDFGSLNGTFVNGQRVKMVTLKPGDSVAIGKLDRGDGFERDQRNCSGRFEWHIVAHGAENR
jgi:pSer/pThr/pTyr-binding forkhead associated (FHA) protein